jgi:hypothetical protein
MELTLPRLQFDNVSTQGELYVDESTIREAYTLELPVKDGLSGSCILPGRYKVVRAFSRHFQRDMPLLENVPHRTGIEIHWGDYPRNTDGCILVGKMKGQDFIGHTQDEFLNRLWPKLESAWAAGDEVWITIQGGQPIVMPVLHPDQSTQV